MGNEIQAFEYGMLDTQTSEFLQRKESNIRKIAMRAQDEIGRELKEAQQELASHDKYKGVFEKWYTSLGYAKQSVYDAIAYHDVVRLAYEMRSEVKIDSLPKKLVYAIGNTASESTPAKAQAKSEVLNGDIGTTKAYRERIAELDALLAEKERSEEILTRQNERLTDELASVTKPETVVVEKEVEKVVEIDKTDYSAVDRLQAYEERFGALENYSDRVRATNVSDVTTSIVSFNMAVRDFIKRHAYLIRYQDTIQAVDKVTQREYNEAVQALRSISADFSKVTGIGDFVDVEFTEVQQ